MNPPACYEQLVPAHLDGARLDVALATLFPDYSRGQLQKWLKEGHATCDQRAASASERVSQGARLQVRPIPTPTHDWLPEQLPIEVLYEDSDILIINKPANLVVHPGAGQKDGTLINGLLAHCPSLIEQPRCGLVHRLDKNTTGLLAVAKTSIAHKSLVAQLQTRTLGRLYQAIVHGILTSGATIEGNIGRHPKNRLKMAITPKGKQATTHFRIQTRFKHTTHLMLKLETGRTHQIRVHLQSIKHPILGDSLYGRAHHIKGAGTLLNSFKRQALHAYQLKLIHPRSEKTLSFTSPLPEDMSALLQALKELDAKP